MEPISRDAWTTDIKRVRKDGALDYNDTEVIRINVGGKNFATTKSMLERYPETRLGNLLEPLSSKPSKYFFDRDDVVFREVLNFFRTGIFRIPQGICMDTLRQELEYWKVDALHDDNLCEKDFDEERMEKEFMWFEKRLEHSGDFTFRTHIWYHLTDPFGPYTKYPKLAAAWKISYLFAVIVQTAICAMLTLPHEWESVTGKLDTNANDFFDAMFRRPCEMGTPTTLKTTLLFFSWFYGAEIMVRLVSCPCKRYFLCSINMADLIVTLIEVPCSALLTIFMIFRAGHPESYASCLLVFSVPSFLIYTTAQFRTIRLLAFMSLFRSMQVLALALKRSLQEIALLCAVMLLTTLLGGFAIYYCELAGTYMMPDGEHELTIRTLPEGYWWTVVTMTTVGYGDYYPRTWLGYIVAVVIMIAGLMFTSLPIAIVGGNFAAYHSYNRKREMRQ